MDKSSLRFSILFFFAAQNLLLAQSRVSIASQNDSLTVLRLDNLDILTRLAGDTDTTHPYYTFLWIFGDGSFINGTRDSVIGHVYEVRSERLFSATSGADVTVYATGNYSGGARPPRMAPSPNDFFRSPSVIRTTLKKELLQNNVDPTPVAIDTSVIDTTLAGLLRLQLNKNARPQDTLVAIMSFRQPQGKPTQPIRGQLYLFFNSRIAPAQYIPTAVEGTIRNSPPPPSPSFSHGKFVHQRNHLHFRNVQDLGAASATPAGISAYTHFLVWNYDSLRNDGKDERHLFAEFGVDSLMWELFRNGRGDTLSFLAVMTAYDFSSDVIGLLPTASHPMIDTTGIANLLGQRYYIGNNTFASLDNADLHGKVIAVSEVKTPVVSSHDPNKLLLYACQCPDTTRRKVVGVINYSNDGNAPTSLVKVQLKVPDQLNLNSIETIQLHPAPATAVSPQIDLTTRTISWAYAALLQPAEAAGFGHPSTQGQITFSLDLKPGFSISDLQPLQACIVFDANDPMCTLPVGASEVTYDIEKDGIRQLLQCTQCPTHPEEGSNNWCWCIKWALLLLALLLLIWLLKRLLKKNNN